MKATARVYRAALPPLALAVAMLPGAAYAVGLGAGGGAGSVFGQIISWVQSNLVTDLITIGVIMVGALMMFMQFNVRLILGVCIGGWIMLNAAQVVGLI